MSSELTAEAYNRIAAWYDLEHAGFLDDLGIYRQYAALTGGPILELASGTGRLTIPLARAGYHITGVDPAAGMLARCQGALTREDPAVAMRVTLVEHTMEDLALDQTGFRLAFVALGSFNHLATLAERRAALQAIRRHVVAGGTLVLDLAQADLRRFAFVAESGVIAHIGTIETPAEGPETFLTHTLTVAPFNAPGSMLLTHWYDQYRQGGPVTRTTIETPFAAISWNEIAALLEATGWHLRQSYGDHDLSVFIEGAQRLIVIAQAAE